MGLRLILRDLGSTIALKYKSTSVVSQMLFSDWLRLLTMYSALFIKLWPFIGIFELSLKRIYLSFERLVDLY